jgi:hypothetical protein
MPTMGNAFKSGCLWLGLNLMFAGFLVAGGWFGLNSWRLVQSGGHTTGKVIDMEASTSDGSTTYSPVIDYVVEDETYRFRSGSSSNPPAYHVGQRVEMLYDLTDPHKAQINNFWELWLLPIIFIPIAVIGGLTVTAVMVLQFFRQRARPQPVWVNI